MGMDIEIKVVKDKEVLWTPTEYLGRNYDWWENIREREGVYDCSAIQYASEEEYKELLPDKYNDEDIKHMSDKQMISVGDFKTWFINYIPCITAGWIPRYDIWLYEKKNITPNPERVFSYKSSAIELFDESELEFVEVPNANDQSGEIYNGIKDLPDDAMILIWWW